jgi:hypothetical protein
MRFAVDGVGGRAVIGARLALHQSDFAAQGGQLWLSPPGTWDETFTWNARPAYGSLLPGAYSYGAVVKGHDYEVGLPAGSVPGDGAYAYALTSSSADGSEWLSRESPAPPRLLVDVTCSTTGTPCDPDDDDDGVPDALDNCPAIPAATPGGCPAQPVVADVSSPAAGGTPVPAVETVADRTPPSVSIGLRRRVIRAALAIRLSCPPEEDVCTGTARAGGATKAFQTKGGKTITVLAALSDRALAAVRSRGTVRLRVRIRVMDEAGNAALTRAVTRVRL